MAIGFDADILSQVQSGNNQSHNQTNNQSEIDYLKSIDAALQNILKSGKGMSQANAANSIPGKKGQQDLFGGLRGPKNFMDEVLDNFEKTLISSVIGSDFKKKINGALGKFAEEMGTNIQDLPSVLGKELGNQLAGKLKETGIGGKLFESVDAVKNRAFDKVKDAYKSGRDSHAKRQSGTSERVSEGGADADAVKGAVKDFAKDRVTAKAKDKAMSEASDKAISGVTNKVTGEVANKAATEVGTKVVAGMASSTGTGSIVSGSLSTLSSASSAIAGLGPALAVVAPYAIAAAAALYALGPAIKGVTELFKGMAKAAGREQASREKNLELEKTRLAADVKSMIEAPMNILKEAAEKVYQAWDSNIRIIAGTQGYSKADLQTLMGQFATRLRDEGLVDVIGGTDVTENLAKVLSSGLSGAIAEEFAYVATVLNAAIPTQDFFGYGGTYASLAANAIRLGASEAEATEYATQQLKSFASSLVYSNRQLAGGFTTGLQNAQSIFEQAVQISQASRTGVPSQIAGVLTSVSAITGAIAPDLASSMVDAIVKAATGGNESSIVALRSLAGGNASNTEFLRQVATNPQKVFTTLFNNLAKMQNMSNDAYMEVAEGLSSVFGISMNAFARIDFNYLAQAISRMNVNDSALNENLALLASGETTTTQEQLRMQQINEYLLEEGLAYVMDNEVARQIQQHMWDEQLAREVMEAEYAVNLQGAALDFLEGIRRTLENVINLLNPIGFLQKRFVNLFGTFSEGAAQSADMQSLLELGKVGNGNSKALYQLLTRNQDLNLIGDIVSLMGGTSQYAAASSSRLKGANPRTMYLPGMGGLYLTSKETNQWFDSRSARAASSYISELGMDSGLGRSVTSAYQWGTLGKSVTASMFSGAGGKALPGVSSREISNTAVATALLSDRFNTMLNSMQEFAKEGTYEEWVKTAKTFGIADFSETVKSAGLTDAALRGKFEEAQTRYGVEQEQAAKAEREAKEDSYWDTLKLNTADIVNLTQAGNNTLIAIQSDTTLLVELITTGNGHLNTTAKKLDQFYKAWEDYFINHSAYSAALKDNYNAVLTIQKKERDGTSDAVNALAEALTQNDVDLLDPAVQTNALLAQILKIVTSLMVQYNAGTPGYSLPDTFTAQATGIVRSI